jgi:hypothetical protein
MNFSFWNREGAESPADVPFINLLSNSMKTNNVDADVGVQTGSLKTDSIQSKTPLGSIAVVSNINMGGNNIVSVNEGKINTLSTSFLQSGTTNPITLGSHIDVDGKNLSEVGELKVTNILTQSRTNAVNYTPMNYEVCERMVGIYNLPTSSAGVGFQFKGPVTGFGASSLIAGAGYDIVLVMQLSILNLQTISFSMTIGNTTFGNVVMNIDTADTYIAEYKVSFQVLTGGATTASIHTYATMDLVGVNRRLGYRFPGGTVNLVSIVNSTLTPLFNFMSDLAGTNWSASRRDYSYIRKY